MHEESPNDVPLAEDLQRALEQLRVKREQEDGEREGAGALLATCPRVRMGSC